jgi:hypothetical protein
MKEQTNMTHAQVQGTRTPQPVPFSTPGAWTITTDDGATVTGYLPAWADSGQ